MAVQGYSKDKAAGRTWMSKSRYYTKQSKYSNKTIVSSEGAYKNSNNYLDLKEFIRTLQNQ